MPNTKIPEDAVQELSTMFDFFMTTNVSLAVTSYADIRRKYLVQSISSLAEQFLKTPPQRINGIYKKGGSLFNKYISVLTDIIQVCKFFDGLKV